MTYSINPSAPTSWKKSFLWLALAVGCFQAAYTSIHHPAAGLLIFGYAYGLVRLTEQPSVRRAFYFGLATAFLSYAPQLFFMWRIFGPAAIVLWLILAFWVGLFTGMVCASRRRWGQAKTAWLIPILWTGLEYFRSELYYLKFSWMNIGYALPVQIYDVKPLHLGMYGVGFILFGLIAMICYWRRFKITKHHAIGLLLFLLVYFVLYAPDFLVRGKYRYSQVTLAGVQMEFPGENLIPKMLDQALAKNTNAAIFVLSEYTLDAGVPDNLKNWCRDHQRYLVVGGKDVVTNDIFYDSAFVVGTNGEVIFRQAKSVPIQFFHDGLSATNQALWNSPWGKIGICICYDLSYTRVTDRLVEQGAALLIVPTMDVTEWGRHQHELHSRVAPVRAAEYGIPIFRVASSGISQAVDDTGKVIAQTSIGGNGEIISAELGFLNKQEDLPFDRYLAPACTLMTGIILVLLLINVVPKKTDSPPPSVESPN